MAKEKATNWILGLGFAVLAILILATSGTPDYPTAEEIASNIDVPTAQEIADLVTPAGDTETTVVTNEDILNEINKDDLWKTEAKNIAFDELRDNDFQDFLNDNGYNILDDQDVISWKIKDYDVSNMDADEQDADVELELRVRYYEDGDEDNTHWIVMYGDFEIREGEVEDFELYF